uniref:Caspase family p20 domain-containing protein n=1 Tax=Acrobeloides nanus TaxID=290746 RepID=A0A914DF62_9BILA
MKYDSCIVVIMGHGDDGTICDIHGEEIDIDHEILSLFNGDNAGDLVEKPKFFIFQACRGGNSDAGAVISSHQQEVNKQKLSSFLKYQSGMVLNKISNLLLKKSPAHSSQRVPIYSDFFVFYATVPTMVSYRHWTGSEFIDSISKVFYKFAHKYDLEDMAIIIKRRVGSQEIKVKNKQTQEEKIKFQQPQFVTTNSKKYFMFPGVHIE